MSGLYIPCIIVGLSKSFASSHSIVSCIIIMYLIIIMFWFFSWQQLDCFDPIKHQAPFCSVLHITWWPQAPVPLCAPWWVHTLTLLLHQCTSWSFCIIIELHAFMVLWSVFMVHVIKRWLVCTSYREILKQCTESLAKYSLDVVWA